MPQPDTMEITSGAATATAAAAAAVNTATERSDKIIGIDLGTAHTVVAVFENGRAEIVPNEHGNRRTPAVIAFTPQERLLGEAAEQQAPNNLPNTVFHIKRLLGKRFCDPRLQSLLSHWPFTVSAAADADADDTSAGHCLVHVTYKSQQKLLSPLELTAMLLAKAKSCAERYVHGRVRRAVVAVPASFSDAQRKATKDAALLAGFASVKLVNQASAVGIAYALQPHMTGCRAGKTVLVVDLGAGALDVAVIAVRSGVLQVTAAAGDTHLGGDDFNHRLVNFCVDRFAEANDFSGAIPSARSLRRLRKECESAKRALSVASETVVEVDVFHERRALRVPVTRAEFEELMAELLARCQDVVRQCMEDAGVAVDEIVLVGGSSRIPSLRQALQELVPGKPFCKTLNVEESVAAGAALKAAAWNKELGTRLSLADVSPFTLAFPMQGLPTTVVFRRNTEIPAMNVVRIAPWAWQRRAERVIPLFQCPRGAMEDSNFLGEFVLSKGRRRGPGRRRRSKRYVDVEFFVDGEGLLTVTAWDPRCGRPCDGVLSDGGGWLSEDEMRSMLEEMRRFQRDDEEAERKHVLMNDFQQYIHIMRIVVKERRRGGGDAAAAAQAAGNAEKVLDLAEEWLGDNVDAQVYDIVDRLGMVSKEIRSHLALLRNALEEAVGVRQDNPEQLQTV